MTLHAAKGLEFDSVIISGLEDSLLPSGHSSYQTEKLEEERRLFTLESHVRKRDYLSLMPTKIYLWDHV